MFIIEASDTSLKNPKTQVNAARLKRHYIICPPKLLSKECNLKMTFSNFLIITSFSVRAVLYYYFPRLVGKHLLLGC